MSRAGGSIPPSGSFRDRSEINRTAAKNGMARNNSARTAQRHHSYSEDLGSINEFMTNNTMNNTMNEQEKLDNFSQLENCVDFPEPNNNYLHCQEYM
jgi:Fe2+ or Zn2+ uptake regulation protein